MQPPVFVHRDYHSRNLMVTSTSAIRASSISRMRCAGPIGYDLVSLLKDCYIGWPRERVERWVKGYRERARQSRAVRWQRVPGIPALVRSHRRAAAHQGARHLRAPVVSRRQGRDICGLAADTRIRARHCRRYAELANFSAAPRTAHRAGAAAVRTSRVAANKPK